MATTPNRGYQLPAPGSKLKDDVLRLIVALGAIDTDVANLLLALADKSNVGHGHAMAEITGLFAALGNKLDVGYHDALANLTDVDVAGVANGMALLRQASKWIPVALQINNIAGLETALNGKATPADITAAINALVAAAPGALDTLNELATALGNDPNFASTITAALAGKQPLDSDLTAIAALTTTAFGRALLTAADAAALRTAANAASADTAIRDDIDQSAHSKASGLKVNILKNTLQAWELVEDVNITTATTMYQRTGLEIYSALRITGYYLSGAAAGVSCWLDQRMMLTDGSIHSAYTRAYSQQDQGSGIDTASHFYGSGRGDPTIGGQMFELLYLATNHPTLRTTIRYNVGAYDNSNVLRGATGTIVSANSGFTLGGIRLFDGNSGGIAEAKFTVMGKRG